MINNISENYIVSKGITNQQQFYSTPLQSINALLESMDNLDKNLFYFDLAFNVFAGIEEGYKLRQEKGIFDKPWYNSDLFKNYCFKILKNF